ncbi:MAG TPA: Do family serine endopeptidase [Burkholderiales bacterium]|jgi:serine protease Do|nr:Do family serine endopeptidase [Burkholderiales bacterium]
MRRIALVALLAFATAVPAQQQDKKSAAGGRTANLPDFTSLMKQQGPAVVNVITKRDPARTARNERGQPGPQGQGPQGPQSQAEDPLLEFFRRFMPDAPERGPGPGPGQGLGSGFIISQDGYVLTNAHVVAGDGEVTVRLADAKREFKAKVIGADERTDIALLKIDATGLPTVKLGKSGALQPGEWVAAIGSPFGFENTITAGIVSATGRSLPAETYVPFIQTDVAVNPGNSGGPLINLAGEVVGVNSMIYSQTGGYMGVSFAIPIEVALEVGKQLRAEGKVTRGRLGVRIQPMTKELAQSFKLESAEGALIATVEPGSPADKAGLKPGDVVMAFNGQKIDDPNKLPRLVAGTKPGQSAALRVWRNGKAEEVKFTAVELVVEAKTPKPAADKAAKPNRLGLVVSELPAAQRRALGIDYGLVVENADASRTALRPGDVIVGVGRESFKSVEDFERLIGEQKQGDTVALLVKRGEATVYVPVEVG